MKTSFLETYTPKILLVSNILLALIYFYIITFAFEQGNVVLFGLLIAGEVFHVWQVLTYIHTVWETEHTSKTNAHVYPKVDVFITVAGEPLEIIEETVRAAALMDYPKFEVYILNDGLVAKKDNWKAVEKLAEKLGVTVITRTKAGGAKAGNINNALNVTASVSNPASLITIFDADHVPHRDFLTKTVTYFIDSDVGFVQTPQYYKNYNLNSVTKSSWEQQQLFFGPICKGKNRLNSATMCGTNMVIRRRAINEVGGMCVDSIAEDFVTGMFLHERGWKSVYVGEVLAEGLAPEDFLSYYKQQFRWARGALDVIFRYNLLFRTNLSFAQKVQYFSSASFYLSGLVVLMNALLPVTFFFTGLVPIEVSSMLLALIFIPYIFVTLYTLQRSSNFSFTFSALAFSMSSFGIHLHALYSVITQRKAVFSITSKRGIKGNYIRLVIPHLIYIGLVSLGIAVAFAREGMSASLVNNTAWAIFNISIFIPFILASLPSRSRTGELKPATVKNHDESTRESMRISVN
ncbi:MAG: glycosyltransferase [Candidatus Paceibacterota bacterium]